MDQIELGYTDFLILSKETVTSALLLVSLYIYLFILYTQSNLYKFIRSVIGCSYSHVRVEFR